MMLTQIGRVALCLNFEGLVRGGDVASGISLSDYQDDENEI